MNTTTARPQIDVHIRWMIRRDMPEVLAIESQCFEFPWDDDAFIRALRNRNVIGMVAEVNERVVGFVLYELHKHKLHVLNFGVHDDFRYKGVARQMVKKLVSKLSYDRRSYVQLLIRETNVDAQLAFKAMGFKCVDTRRDCYEETTEDAYDFRYRQKDTDCEGK